jgi:hypothetical protein
MVDPRRKHDDSSTVVEEVAAAEEQYGYCSKKLALAPERQYYLVEIVVTEPQLLVGVAVEK